METSYIPPLEFAGTKVYPGEKKRIEIPISRLPTQTWVSVPVQVIFGIKPGPCVALIAGIHGDEINGMEVIREILRDLDPQHLAGCIILVPVVNIFGFLHNSRYLPDGRDLNRSFPGNSKGSMAARLAHLFTQEVLKKADYAVDFHTAALGRMNYPHIRTSIRSKDGLALAQTFGAPVIVHSKTIEGSLRQAAKKFHCKLIVFEGGEVNRFNNDVIQIAVSGVWQILKKLKMCKPVKKRDMTTKSKVAKSSTWVRAHRSGIFRLFKNLGDHVTQKELIGVVTNIFGDVISKVRATHDGMIIGMASDPKVHKGEAIIHIAKFS